MKTILLSKTFWVQVIALVILVFPPVKMWFDANPVGYLSALAAVNVLLRFITSGAVSILPTDDDDTMGQSGRQLMGFLLLAGMAGGFGCLLPSCSSPGGADMPPIHATYRKDGVTVGYSSKAGLSVDVDQTSGK